MSEHRIPPPREDRPPLKANIFERMQVGNCQLMPLFPYLDEDALVPCGALFRGAAGAEWGQFFHQNSVDEVIQVFGAEGATLQTGSIYVTQPLHGVNSFLKNPSNPDAFLVLIITQHQSTGAVQKEAILYRCGKCHELLVKHEYDATPMPRNQAPPDEVPTLTTLQGSMDAEATYNEHPDNRHCPKCGYDNPPFPGEHWGWREYIGQTRTVNEARRALEDAARQMRGV
ncbi:MAG TPA: hypothetical protein VGJ60_08840 [Chloroflexota bacterium]